MARNKNKSLTIEQRLQAVADYFGLQYETVKSFYDSVKDSEPEPVLATHEHFADARRKEAESQMANMMKMFDFR